MATELLAPSGTVPVGPRPFVDRLHGWIATVDHKRLGVMYILYALVFLLLVFHIISLFDLDADSSSASHPQISIEKVIIDMLS